MAIEGVLVPAIVFAMPVAIVWIRTHYKALEKGHVRPLIGDGEKVAKLEAQNRELMERIENLESIVVALDEAPRRKALPSAEKMSAE